MVNEISIYGNGYIFCKSTAVSAQDVLSCENRICLKSGINELKGDIDSGVWAISYLLSMYPHSPEDFILFDNIEVIVDGIQRSLQEISSIACYMDKIHPIFSNNNSIKDIVSTGLFLTESPKTIEEIREMFFIPKDRFERPISGVGNDVFKSMAAIGYSFQKDIYCFPWMSRNRYNYYKYHMFELLNILEELGKFVLLPIDERINTGDGTKPLKKNDFE